MADITKLQDFDFIQLSTPTNGQLSLAEPISASDTTFTVSFAVTDEDSASIVKDFFIELTSIYNGKLYTETMLVTSVSGNEFTVVRGIDRGGLDYTGNASNAIPHIAGTIIKANLPAGLFQAHDSALKGEIATGGTHLKIGLGTDVNSGIKAHNADVNKPYIEYDAATNAWIASNDGTSSFALGTGAGSITGGDGITVTAGDIDVDLTDTTIFKTARTGNESRATVTAASDGRLDKTFMPTYVQDLIDSGTTVAEIDQALDGISANVTAANLGTLTAGSSSNADALHRHGVGVKALTGSYSNSTQNASGTGTFTIDVGNPNSTRVRFYYALVCGRNNVAGNSGRWKKESGIIDCDFTNYSVIYSSSSYDSVQQVYSILNFFDSFPNTSKSTLPSLTGLDSDAVAITGITKNGNNIEISYSYHVANTTYDNNTTIDIRGTAF